tara:strand:+ start:472 stop:1089 length:618 start_codon:yes stop_codon:yes gene_type:complete
LFEHNFEWEDFSIVIDLLGYCSQTSPTESRKIICTAHFVMLNYWNVLMVKESYRWPFLNFIEQFGDPYGCWQEDGFWPGRVSADFNHLLVWVTEIALGYIDNGGLAYAMQCEPGRTMPEMQRGFEILGCLKTQAVCTRIIKYFGDDFPRNDEQRSTFIAKNESLFNQSENELWDARESEKYEFKVEEYFKKVCVAHSIPPRVYPN